MIVNDKFPYQEWSEVEADDYYRILGYIESFAQEDPNQTLTADDISNAMLYAYYLGTLRGAQEQKAQALKKEATEWWDSYDPADWDAPVQE